jgi:hypothetical protein
MILLYRDYPDNRRNRIVHTFNEICAEVLDENGKAKGKLQRQVRSILTEILTES